MAMTVHTTNRTLAELGDTHVIRQQVAVDEAAVKP
jgi:hypothetical protein